MQKTNPKVSIVVPIHDMKNGAFFLWRCINSIMEQTFKDYEIIITKEGSMPVNTNAGIKKAKGELIKILYMDDWFAYPEALSGMVDILEGAPEDYYDMWLISATDTNTDPRWTDDIETGNNKLGSPSALMFRNQFEENLLFDENLSWLLDCDLYKRMHKKFGQPSVMRRKVGVNIGVHEGQMTNLMSDDYKLSEHEYVREKYKQN